MKNIFLLLGVLFLFNSVSQAKVVDSITCFESIYHSGWNPSVWQPYVQYVRTPESRPDVAVELRKGQSIQFLKSNISVQKTQMVLYASTAKLTPMQLILVYTNKPDPTGNRNLMAKGMLKIASKKVGPLFDCGISFH